MERAQQPIEGEQSAQLGLIGIAADLKRAIVAIFSMAFKFSTQHNRHFVDIIKAI